MKGSYNNPSGSRDIRVPVIFEGKMFRFQYHNGYGTLAATVTGANDPRSGKGKQGLSGLPETVTTWIKQRIDEFGSLDNIPESLHFTSLDGSTYTPTRGARGFQPNRRRAKPAQTAGVSSVTKQLLEYLLGDQQGIVYTNNGATIICGNRVSASGLASSLITVGLSFSVHHSKDGIVVTIPLV